MDTARETICSLVYKLSNSSPFNQLTDKPYTAADSAFMFLTASSGSCSPLNQIVNCPSAGTVQVFRTVEMVEIRGADMVRLMACFTLASRASSASLPSTRFFCHTVWRSLGKVTPAEGSISYDWPLQKIKRGSPDKASPSSLLVFFRC